MKLMIIMSLRAVFHVCALTAVISLMGCNTGGSRAAQRDQSNSCSDSNTIVPVSSHSQCVSVVTDASVKARVVSVTFPQLSCSRDAVSHNLTVHVGEGTEVFVFNASKSLGEVSPAFRLDLGDGVILDKSIRLNLTSNPTDCQTLNITGRCLLSFTDKTYATMTFLNSSVIGDAQTSETEKLCLYMKLKSASVPPALTSYDCFDFKKSAPKKIRQCFNVVHKDDIKKIPSPVCQDIEIKEATKECQAVRIAMKQCFSLNCQQKRRRLMSAKL